MFSCGLGFACQIGYEGSIKVGLSLSLSTIHERSPVSKLYCESMLFILIQKYYNIYSNPIIYKNVS